MKPEQIIQLKPDEEIITIVRRYGLTYWYKITLTFIWITAPFFFLFPLFKVGAWGVILFFVVLISGLFFTTRMYYLWRQNMFIVTNIRVIDVDRQGILSRVITDAIHQQIEDVSYRKRGLFQTVLNYGQVNISMTGNAADIYIPAVKHPEDLCDMLNDLRRQEIYPSETPSKTKKVKSMIEDLSDDELAGVENDLKSRARDKAMKKLYSKE